MNALKNAMVFLVVGMMVAASGCASVMSGRTAEVTISSNVPDARVVVRDKRGQEVASTRTPATLELQRQEKFAVPAQYMATIEAPGYETAQVPIRSTVNPWVWGNVLIGGLVGLAVDNATGAAWKPKQSSIHGELAPLGPGTSPYLTAEHPTDVPAQPTSSVY